jgi:hypothetical protein
MRFGLLSTSRPQAEKPLHENPIPPRVEIDLVIPAPYSAFGCSLPDRVTRQSGTRGLVIFGGGHGGTGSL